MPRYLRFSYLCHAPNPGGWRAERVGNETTMEPMYDEAGIQIYHAEALELLKSQPDEMFGAVITDPPYSSGGLHRSDRSADPNTKYASSTAQGLRADFSGDGRSERAWGYWCTLWASECLRIVRPGGYFMMFSDWRMLPTASDVLQAAGFIWRGIVPWNKGRGARAAHKGLIRHQCEYIVWGTRGVSVPATHDGPYDGYIESEDVDESEPLPPSITCPTRQSDKFHLTGKPVDVLTRLVRMVPPDGTVVDPFMGSGTTAVACANTGRRFVGCDYGIQNCQIAVERLRGNLKDAMSLSLGEEPAADPQMLLMPA